MHIISCPLVFRTACWWYTDLQVARDEISRTLGNDSFLKNSASWKPFFLAVLSYYALMVPQMYYVSSIVIIYYLVHTLFYLFFIFLSLFWERERESASQRRAEIQGDRIPSRFHAVNTEPEAGVKLTNREIMTWAKVKSAMLNLLIHPDTPSV